MTSRQLKDYLYNNPSFIVKVLESLDCHEIKHTPNKRVSAALPDGDNPMSVQVLIDNNWLNTVVHTRSDYKGKDIYDFVGYIKKCNFRNAFLYICRVLNLDCTFEYTSKAVNETYEFLKGFSSGNIQYSTQRIKNTPLDDSILEGYINFPHKKFLDDNLSIQSQQKFQISYDIHNQRILIPIRNTEGRLVTIKGRTIHDDWKEKGIMKYVAYYPYSASCILFGYYENYWNILLQQEVILVESEKAVIQADSYGVNNVVALSKKTISDEQLYKIIQLNVDVTLALDKDVELDELKQLAEEFQGLCNVYAIYDTENLLDDKDSPFDKGADIWKELYKNKIQLI